ncbi:MAG: MBL fold metallo-hydrolase [Bdellovibrionaceae bacterium]|nr:MBL fold metallo-hydrolase [Pseudobdellovibrionaceae bacterium]NUM60124.1 MBL fold metallo-hydrolase [Pseudobdellovibrionaceae bacterium]
MSKLKISRVLHAGYVLEVADGKLIAFDPIFENPFSHNCYAYPNVIFDYKQIKNLNFEAVFISHFHDDHCSLESLKWFDRNTPIYLFCIFDEIFELIKKLGFKKVYSIKLEEKISIGLLNILPLKAVDEDVDTIFHIEFKGINILNVVDSWIHPETMKKLSLVSRWDLVIWPFQTMRELEVLSPKRFLPSTQELPFEWIKQLEELNPKYLIPSSCQFIHESWSWYNHAFFPISYEIFKSTMQKIIPQTTVIRLDPSKTLMCENTHFQIKGRLSWVVPIGNQEVDYVYLKDLNPPKTYEISPHFGEVSDTIRNKILDYCHRELLVKYSELDEAWNAYFAHQNIWKLSLYDHLGKSEDFYYLIQKQKILLLTEIPSKEKVSWYTEIPMLKLYSALEYGEALTSLYMRINDIQFSDEVEVKLKEFEVDILEDPLVRCLFSCAVGSYQNAQLNRILKQL